MNVLGIFDMGGRLLHNVAPLCLSEFPTSSEQGLGTCKPHE